MSTRFAAVVTGLLTGPLLLAGCTGTASPDDGPRQSSTQAQSPAGGEGPGIDEVRSALEERVRTYDGIATGVIALVRVGDETATVVAGQADVRRRVDMAPDQRWPVASLTKMMTATVLMQLVEEGRLALDDPAETWLPELREVEPTITVEQLLAHRSGLRDSGDRDIRRFGFDTSALVRAAAGHPLDFEPGTRGSYANVGFGALGLLVERVLGQSLGEVLQARIFGPVGMEDSTLYGRPDVHGYEDGRDMNDQLYLRLLPAAGSVVSTAHDIDLFMEALAAGQLVGADSLAAMRTPRGPVGFWSDYGLGQGMETFTCGTAWGHGGRLNGFSSEAWTLEQGDRTAVVVVNDTLSDVVRSVADAALCGG